MTTPDSSSFLRVINVHSADVTLDGIKRIIRSGSSEMEDGCPVFFVVDVLYDEAFGHWHAETAIFLRYWHDLIKEYPSLQILLKTDRIYKRLALKAYGIPVDRTVFGGPEVLPEKNLCIFPPLFLLNDHGIDVSIFTNMWAKHIEYLHKAAGVSADTKKSITTLGLPRQTRENYKPNDRVIPGTKEMCEQIEALDNSLVLHTDNVDDLLEQVRIVASSQNIIVIYGSAFLVNGSFAMNSHIRAIAGTRQHFPGIQAIIKWIKSRGNTVVFE